MDIYSWLLISVTISLLCRDTVGKTAIAVIGGGIGGTSCSHFLSELFGEDAEIDLYEYNEIGGRLRTVMVAGREYEAGGSVIHPANRYMKNFTELLHLKERDRDGGRLAIFNGNELVFDGSEYNMVMILQLFYHYGWDIMRIKNYVKDLLNKFERIYNLQDDGQAFTTVENLLRGMDPDFVEMMHTSIADNMKTWGFHEKFIDQLVLGGMRTNYGQNTNIHGFVGSVSMAGVEPGLWSVYGGNKLVASELLAKSKARLKKKRVKRITLFEQNKSVKYKVTSVDENGSEKFVDYDYVIIAAPLYDNLTQIEFSGFPKPVAQAQHHFHRTLATFVHGVPNGTKVKVTDVNEFPEELLTCNEQLFFSSLGKQTPVNWTKAESEIAQTPTVDEAQNSVFKVFSNEPLTDTQIKDLFVSYDKVKVVDWMAYPQYSSNEQGLPPFELYDHLYYINAIEMAASAMEMSVIGARNAALLAYHSRMGSMDKVDDPALTSVDHGKTEL